VLSLLPHVLQVPNVTVAEINIELEFQMTFVLEYDASANVWDAPRKAKVEMLHLDRTVRGNNVPLPRTLLRFDFVLGSIARHFR